MKYLKLAFLNVPDQVLSTFLLWGCGFVIYRGFASIFTHFPSKTTLLVVLCIGVVLGLIVSFGEAKEQNENNKKVSQVDK